MPEVKHLQFDMKLISSQITLRKFSAVHRWTAIQRQDIPRATNS